MKEKCTHTEAFQGTLGQENQCELQSAKVTKALTKLSTGKQAAHSLTDEMPEKRRPGLRRVFPQKDVLSRSVGCCVSQMAYAFVIPGNKNRLLVKDQKSLEE